MKVGEAGEAFFVLELDDSSYGNESIPDDLVTSPILSAASSPAMSATGEDEVEDMEDNNGASRTPGAESKGKGRAEEDVGGGMEPLDLGAAEESGPSLTGGTGNDQAQSKDQENYDEEEDARSGTTEIRSQESRSSRSRSQDSETTDVTTPRSGPVDRSVSPERNISKEGENVPRHSKNKGYDQDTSVPDSGQARPPSNTADPTGPLSSLSNAASKASGVVSAAGRAIISPVTSLTSDPTADGAKNSKLENVVKNSGNSRGSNDEKGSTGNKSQQKQKAPVEGENAGMETHWNNNSAEEQDGGITKGASKQERDEEKKSGEGEAKDENVVERSEAEQLEFQMQKRALDLVKAEQEASSPSVKPRSRSQSFESKEDDSRAPSSALAQVEDSKSSKDDDSKPISNALLAEEAFPKPFGMSSTSEESSQADSSSGVKPVKTATSSLNDDPSFLDPSYENRNPISSSLNSSTPMKSKSETYPVSQPDHHKYLAGTLLETEEIKVGESGESREFNKAGLDPRVVRRKIEKAQEKEKLEKARDDDEQKEEEKKLKRSPKIERREGEFRIVSTGSDQRLYERLLLVLRCRANPNLPLLSDLQYMLDIDGYKMTADGEDLAFAEGHRLANEMPLSKKHGGNGRRKGVKAKYNESALADEDDDEEDESERSLDSGKEKSTKARRTSFVRTGRTGVHHGHRSSRSMSRNRQGRNGSSSLSRKEGNSTRRDFKSSLSGTSAMGHHLQARLRTRRSSSSLLDDLTHELSSGDERPVLGLGANSDAGGSVEKESLSLSRDLARLARITRDNHQQSHSNHPSRRSNLSEGNLTPTSPTNPIQRRRTRSTKISGGPLGAGPRNRARSAASSGHFKEFSYSDTEAEVPALRQKARRGRGKNSRNEGGRLTLAAKGRTRFLNQVGDSSVPNTPSFTSFPRDESQSFETDQGEGEELEGGERTPPAHPESNSEDPNHSPEYEWGWGALPKKKTQEEKDRRARVVSLGGSRAMAPNLDDEDDQIDASYDTAATRGQEEETQDQELSIDAINKANEKPPIGKLRSDDADPYLFRLELDDASHEFELSLCFDDTFGTSTGAEDEESVQERDDYNFEENKVSFQRFVDDDQVVDDERLVVRYNSRYLTWESASAVLATLSLYRKTLSAAEMDRSESAGGNDGALDGENLNTQPRASVWSRWWNRKGALASASTSNPPTLENQEEGAGKESSTSPPTPGLPRSLDRSRTDSVLETGNLDTPRPAGATSSSKGKEGAESKKTYAKTLRLTSDQLKSLNLKKGANTITFSVTSSYSGVATCTARIFFWESFHRVVVSDIDGTITKSDALGHVFTMMGRDWTHLGVAKLYTDIARNGYRIMYLTSRAIGQADSTRDYLKGIKQNNYQLPDGPVIMSPDRLMASLHREVILRKPEVFKMACLRDIARLFGADPRHAQAQPGGKWPGVSKESLKAANGIGAGGESSPAGGAATAGNSAQESKQSTSPSSSPSGSPNPQQKSLELGAQAQKEDSESTHQSNPTPFYAGFGNRITDALSYRSVNIPSSRIFTIDSGGEVKMELLELAGYKSS